MDEPLYVRLPDYEADRGRYMRLATPDQRVIVLDDNGDDVLSMGGMYVIPDADDSRRLREVLDLLRARVASGDVRASVLREVEGIVCGKSSPKT